MRNRRQTYPLDDYLRQHAVEADTPVGLYTHAVRQLADQGWTTADLITRVLGLTGRRGLSDELVAEVRAIVAACQTRP